MKTLIHLNEWTKLEIIESKEKLKKLIAFNGDKNGNFIEVTMINSTFIETKPHRLKDCWEDIYKDNSEGYNKENEIKIELYIKRILFFYELDNDNT